jgi:ribonuclease Z
MRLTLLGTGSPLPDPNRAGPATLIQTDDGASLLFDCGRGVLMRLAAAGLLPPMLGHVLLTHLHSDHVTDFNDVVTMRWAMSPTPNPLAVVGPPGTAAFVDRTLAMLSDDVGYRIAHHDDLDESPRVDTTEVLDEAFHLGGVLVIAAPTDHRPVHPTVGYRVEHGGRSIVIAGDTVPCDGLDHLCDGADVYVQTVIRPDLVAQVPSARLQDIVDYHSSVTDAAATAKRAGVGTLVLTHMVPAVAPGAEQEWIDLAAEHFDGDIVLGHDLLTIDV